MTNAITHIVVQTGPDHPTIDITHEPGRPWVIVKLIGERWIGPVARYSSHRYANTQASLRTWRHNKKIAELKG